MEQVWDKYYCHVISTMFFWQYLYPCCLTSAVKTEEHAQKTVFSHLKAGWAIHREAGDTFLLGFAPTRQEFQITCTCMRKKTMRLCISYMWKKQNFVFLF